MVPPTRRPAALVGFGHRGMRPPWRSSSLNDDLGRRQRRFARLSYRLFARSVRQDPAALGVRRGNDIREPVPAAYSPSPCNVRYLVEQRFAELLPLKLIS